LQSLLKPYQGELEIYPVDKAVGKVGNNSPSFIVPIDSTENKKNIANFFGIQKAKAGEIAAKNEAVRKAEAGEETRETGEDEPEAPESNAPLPTKAATKSEEDLSQTIKNETNDLSDSEMIKAQEKQIEQGIKREQDTLDDEALLEAEKSPPRMVWKSPSKSPVAVKKELPSAQASPVKGASAATSKMRSATSNGTQPKTPTKEQNRKITSFFGK
jgi:hypothetical protein